MQLRFSGAKLLVRTMLWALGTVVVAVMIGGATALGGDASRQIPFAAALVDILPGAVLLYARDLGWKGMEPEGKWLWGLAFCGFIAFSLLWRWFLGYAFDADRPEAFGSILVWMGLFMSFEPDADEEAAGEFESAYGASELIENVDPRSAVWNPMSGVLYDPLEDEHDEGAKGSRIS